MKKHSKISYTRGSALLLVLGCVALLTLLVVAFLATTSTERSTANFYSRGVSTSLLSEEVLNLVTAQIHQGTLSLDSNPHAAGYPNAVVTWTSQPGMIRTFNNTGAASSFYKLYSSDIMVGTGAYSANLDANDTPPLNWSNLSSIYTDLNQPINNVYPIVDNNNLVGGYTDPVSGKTGLMTYGSVSNPSVEGFSVDPNTAFSSASNTLAMPVQWIYVLQDGTLAAPTWTPGVNKATVAAASRTNPIVGRVAFWTDDETCKVNINTASEGHFWDAPLADGYGERNLAYNLPVKGEYNRVPGHPATVSLSSLFRDLYPPSYSSALTYNALSNPADITPLQNLLALTPRSLFGGSQFGTSPVPLTPETSAQPAHLVTTYTSTMPPPSSPSPVDNKGNRLYASVDELLYSTTQPTPNRVVNPPAITGVNPTPVALTPSIVQRSRFFATTSSRAPEVTLFNTPRISMWPITWPWNPTAVANTVVVPDVVNSISQNAYYTNTAPPMLQSSEKLLAYCGTVGGWPYYFQRQDAYSTTNDWTSIRRNQDLIRYLRVLTSATIPGYGGNFLTKYGADRDQILTEMFDYIRSGPNLNNNTVSAAGATVSNYNFAPVNNRQLTNYGSIWGGTVAPLVISALNTKGAGRYSTVKGVTLVFYAADRYKVLDSSGNPVAGPDVYTQEPAITNSGTSTAIQRHYINFPGAWKVGSSAQNNLLLTQKYGMQTTSLGMYLAFDIADISPGYIAHTPNFYLRVVPGNNGTGYGSFIVSPVMATNPTATWSATTLDFPYPTSNYDYNANLVTTNVNGGAVLSSGGAETWAECLGVCRAFGGNVAKSFTHGIYDPRRYPLFSTPIPVDPQGGDLQFSLTAPDLAVQIWTIDPTTISNNTMTKGELVQTIQLPLSKLSGIYPMPCAPAYTKAAATNGFASKVITMGPPPSINPAPGLSGTLLITSSSPLNYYTSPTGTSSVYTGVVTKSGTTVVSGFIQFPSIEVDGMSFPMNSVIPPTIHYYLTDQTLATTVNGSITALKDPITNASYMATNTVNQYTDMRNLEMRANQTMQATGIWGFGYAGYLISQPVDTAISLVLDPINGTAGDLRVSALTTNVPNSIGGWFVAHYGNASFLNSTSPAGSNNVEATSLGVTDSVFNVGYRQYETKLGLSYYAYYGGGGFAGSLQPTKIIGLPNEAPKAPVKLGDFANGWGSSPDGAIIPKPDDSNWTMGIDFEGSLQVPYFGGYNGEMDGKQPFFSPARQISGPIAFGVLPTGVKATAADISSSPSQPSNNSWRTLAFNPNPAVPDLTAPTHLGLLSPPDYLLLDDFWMPVVEPYAISEPLSTAGKINLNYQMVPFNHITRRTGLYAAMKSDVIMAIPAAVAATTENAYKSAPPANTWGFRFPVDVPHTLELLDYQSSNNNRPFLSAAEICSVFLVPQLDQIANPYTPPLTPLGGLQLPSITGQDPAGHLLAMQKWWQVYTPTTTTANGSSTALTGVNARQQPYAHLYSLLTTKSNTYRVHMRVQLLKKASNLANNLPNVYDENASDQVVGEYRGSATIERYVDPSDPNLAGVDFATGAKAFGTPGVNTLDSYYKYRVTSVNAFTP